jgi:hypothetical protein
MELPFSMENGEREIGDVFPGLMRSEPPGGEEDMEVGVVIAWATRSLQNDDGTDIELLAGGSGERIL